MNKNTSRLLIALIALTLSACGGDDEDSNNSNNQQSTPTTIECGGITCDVKTQYCVQTRVGSFDAPTSDFCLTKPTSCTSCDCLDVTADFEAQQNGTNNCTGAIVSCAGSNGAISASCTRSTL